MIWAVAATLVFFFSVWGWRHASSASAYFAASRTAGPILAGLGGTAAGLSAFVFVGGPGLFAALGAASLWIILSAPVTGALQCWAIGERIVELVEREQVLTVPGLIAARFGNGAPRALAALAVVLGGIATLAVQIKGTAVIGAVLLEVPGWWIAIPTVLATVAYTAAGGMRAGLIAEAVQGGIMAFSAVAIAGVTLWRAGGPASSLATIARLKPELLEVWSADGPTAGIGLFLLFALGTCAQPHYLQKFLMIRDRRSLRWLPAVMTLSLISVLTVWVGVGLGGSALWLQGELQLEAADQLAPTLLRVTLPGWLGSIAVVAILAAVMSTAASLLNLVAAALTRDLPIALRRSRSSEISDGSLLWARTATVVTAAAATLIGLTAERSVALLGVFGWGTFTAAFLPTMLLGMNWKGSSRRGVVAALVIGPVVQLSLEAMQASAMLSPSWEPGLTGAAAGCLALVLLSEPGHDGGQEGT